MRKLISVILAVASIVCTTSSLAASSTGALISESRNDISVMETEQTSVADMPAFRGGDTIQFNVDGLTNEKFLTIISYKYNSDDFSDATIQYIDQYTIDSSTKMVEYTVRETTKEGIYKLSLSGNDETGIVDFYYKVGNPVITMMPKDENTNYWNIESYESNGETLWAVGFVAKAVVGSNEVSIEELGVKGLGIKLTANGKTVSEALTQEQFKAISTAQKYYETSGSVAFVYGLTVYGIDSVASADAISAEAYHQDN